MSLSSLAKKIKNCRKCPLHKSRKNAVPGEGPQNAKLFFVGEAPGKQEDKTGRPFVGRSGDYLNRLLKKNNISRKKVFITGAVKCRPPSNHAPTSKELEICKKLYLDRQIEIIKPKLIVVLGTTALKSLLNKTRLKSLHGKTITKNNQEYFITYHPAAAMRFPKINRLMKKDFQKLKTIK